MWKLKLWENYSFDKTQICFTLKLVLQSNCDNIQLWQNSNFYKTKIVMKPLWKVWIVKNSNCDKSKVLTKLKLWPNTNCGNIQIMTSILVRRTWKLTNLMKFTQGTILWPCHGFFNHPWPAGYDTHAGDDEMSLKLFRNFGMLTFFFTLASVQEFSLMVTFGNLFLT